MYNIVENITYATYIIQCKKNTHLLVSTKVKSVKNK